MADNYICNSIFIFRTMKKKFPFPLLVGTLIILIYFLMAYMLVCSKFFAEDFSELVRYSLGGIFFVYAIYRTYRLYAGTKITKTDV